MSGCPVPGAKPSAASRVARGLLGGALAVANAFIAVQLVRIGLAVWQRGGTPDVYGFLLGLAVPATIVGLWALSQAVHAVRGTRPAHPALPVALAVLAAVALTVHRAGGIAPIVEGEYGPGPVLMLGLAVLVAALAAHVAVHELGHLAGGWASGARFQALRLGLVQLRRDGERLRVGWNPLRLRGVLGSVATIPREGPGFERRYAVMIAGGPAATVVATVASWIGARAVSPPDTDAQAVVSFVLWHATFAGAFLAVMNLLPLRLRTGFRTDGAKALLALTARTPAQREALRFIANASVGRRPRDWGRPVDALALASDDPRHPEVRLAAVAAALDGGEWTRAEDLLARRAAGLRQEDAVRQELELQASLLASLVRGDAATARARLGEVGPMAMRDYPLLAQAALAAAEGRTGDAGALLTRWRAALERAGHPAFRVGNEWAEERLEAMLAAPRTGVA